MLLNYFDISDVLLELRSCSEAMYHVWSKMGCPTRILLDRLAGEPYWCLVWDYEDGISSRDYTWWFHLGLAKLDMCDFHTMPNYERGVDRPPVEEYIRGGNVEDLDTWLEQWSIFRRLNPERHVRKRPFNRRASNLQRLRDWIA